MTNKVSVIDKLEVDEVLPDVIVLMYPNPASDNLIIESGSSIEVALYDVVGRCYYQGSASNIHIINTLELGNAPYIVTYSDNRNKISGQRIIIVNHL